MSTLLLAASAFDLEGFTDAQSLEYRRASQNMKLAAFATEKIMAQVPDKGLLKNPRTAIISATGHGELDSTVDFLVSKGIEDRPKPIAFQNSLHNSTLGFLSIKFGTLGPGFTISNGWNSVEHALDLSDVLFESGAVDTCLLISGDSFLSEHEQSIRTMYQPNLKLMSYYGALLLANTQKAKELGISGPRIKSRVKTGATKTDEPFNSSMLIDRIRIGLEQRLLRVKVERPDQTVSEIEFEWP